MAAGFHSVGAAGLGGGDGDRAGLDDADGLAFAAVAVQDPLHVDGVAVVPLDGQHGVDHGGDLLLVEHPAVDQAGRHGGLDHAADGVVEVRHHVLGRHLVAQDAPVGLADLDVVRRDQALHHRLAPAPAGLDDDAVGLPGDRVGGERHPGGPGVDQLDDADRHRHVPVVRAGPQPVGHRARVEQAGPALADRLEHAVRAGHPEVGVEDPGEAGRARVLADGRAAHRGRDVDLEAARAQLLVGVADQRGQVRVDVPAGQFGPDGARGGFDLGGPGVRAEPAERGVDHLVQARLLPVPPVRLDRDGEPLRQAHARPEQFGEPAHLGAADADGLLRGDLVHPGDGVRHRLSPARPRSRPA